MGRDIGEIENPTKSAFSLEYYDSSWEHEYMIELENDAKVSKWTKNHGIQIKYFDEDNKFRSFNPDFLVEYADGKKELHETKGTHLMSSPRNERKIKSAREWCKVRKMDFRIISKYE